MLADRVTVVLTTSPSPIHPSTEHTEAVLTSLTSFAPALQGCRRLVMCDGCSLREKSEFRSGRVTQSALEAYASYKTRLKAKSEEHNFEMVELEEHHGFGLAVKRALMHEVSTPFVFVVQHDREMVRFVDLAAILSVMEGHAEEIGYVLLPITTTRDYATTWRSKLGMHGIRGPGADLNALSIPVPGGVGDEPRCLLPCLQWHDSTHLARSDFYRDFVFSRQIGIKRGGFIEDKLGQAQVKDVIARGIRAASAHWKLWLFQDGLGRCVAHLDGSSGHGGSVAQQQKQ